MIRILPVVKGVYKPRFDCPFQIIKVSSSGSFIVVQGRKNEMIERNISDVKRAVKPIQRKMTYKIIKPVERNEEREEEQFIHPNQEQPRYPARQHSKPNRYGVSI